MAEISLPFKKHVNEVEMEPTISTPLQQEAKRKRPHRDETDVTNRKRRRKKMYRPKVIGEGRKRESKGTSMPAKHKQVTPKPPKTSRLITPNPVLQNLECQTNRSEKSTEDDNQITATVSCRDLVVVGKELENEKAFSEVAGIEAKEAEEDNSKSIVVHTTIGLRERLYGWFWEISHLPPECKRRRSWRRQTKITERRPYGSRYARGNSGGSRNRLLPFLFCQRKRNLIASRCNLASLFPLPACNQLLRRTHNCAPKSRKAKKYNGNDIFPIVGWLLKGPRNRKKSQVISKFNCKSNSREFDCQCQSPQVNSELNDEDEDTTRKEFDHQSPRVSSKLKCNGSDDDEGTTIKEFDCQSPQVSSKLNYNTRDDDEGTTMKELHSQSPQVSPKLNCISREDDVGITIKEFDCHSPQVSSKLNCNSRDDDGGIAINEFDCQSPGLKSNGRDASMGTAITDVNNHGTTTKGSAQTTLSPASSNFSDMQGEWALRKMRVLSQKLSNHNGQLTMSWLDIRHFLTNSKFLNGRNEKNPPEKGISLPITTGLHHVGSGGSLIRQPDFTLSARPSGSTNEMRPALNLILWDRSEGTRTNHEHIRVTDETRGILGEETDSHKKLLVPHAVDGRDNEAQFENLPTYVGTVNSTSLSYDNSQKEGTDLSNEKQILPDARKRGKKTSKRGHNPSSVHGKQGAIVPHHKTLNSTKKKELCKVYLDSRDITVWQLAIQDESNFRKGKIDDNTDKWWANEREFFRGRIYAFNAMMHSILGDRRFSPWKGSVVDSVIGVFLTQNVSDHLSSSAYMSLAATFPLRETRDHTENYGGQEVLCIQQSSLRNKGFFLCESKWNNGSMSEGNKTTGDPEEATELTSANDAISSQDFQGLSTKQSLDETLLSSTCLEDDCETCLSTNLDDTDDTVLHSNKSTFEQDLYSSSQTSTSSCGSNQKNKILESKEAYCRNQNPISENLNLSCTMDLLRSFGKFYLCSECISKSKSGLENNSEDSNRCERMEVDLQFTPNEKSQRLVDSVGKFQNQEIQLNSDVKAKCPLCSECNNQTKNEIKKTTEIYNYNQERTEAGSQLSPIDDTSEKLDIDGEKKVQSQESVTQASNNTNDTEDKGAQKYLKDRDSSDIDYEKKTEVPKGKVKRSKMKQEIDWNSLRKKWDSMRRVYPGCEPRSRNCMDSVDWEAVRSAEPIKIAHAIQERGQHNIIAGRIKDFLNRTARIHGSIDLEWLRNAPSNDVKEYLLEIDGLGLKSVECIRLLALQQVAFPVDINVGRIAVRLGWVPLEPLPEEVQMHLLETFPIMDSIQKYLWPRLCTLDQRTLYELHYQLITFGKVFCTKRKPNCNACPLRAECRHYASAFASARLALPGLPEKRIVSTMVPDKGSEGTAQMMSPASVLRIDGNPFTGSGYQTNNCEPVIEEPQSPEPAYDESQLTDIEDLCEYDSDDVPIIRLSSGRFTTTSQNCMDNNITRALVPLNANVASIPMPKLKHIDRLRTEHQAYELPDDHPLLSELERREPNDTCPYLLCILSPGETVDSSEPPNTRCTYQELGELCTGGSCSSCNIAREQNSGTVRGTILIPCRTAMRGKFPLNGTYFQVNEVFADDESSKNPIHVPREWIWDLPRRITYFGTSTTTIFRGLAMEDIQYCFQKGFVCVRGFDRRTRTPKRLAERLHRATHASAKARAKKNENQKKKPYVSTSNSPQQL